MFHHSDGFFDRRGLVEHVCGVMMRTVLETRFLITTRTAAQARGRDVLGPKSVPSCNHWVCPPLANCLSQSAPQSFSLYLRESLCPPLPETPLRRESLTASHSERETTLKEKPSSVSQHLCAPLRVPQCRSQSHRNASCVSFF